MYGNCTELREFFEASGQAYVLRVPSNFTLTLASGVTATCAGAVSGLLTGKRARDKRLWEVRSAGKGSKGDRWYAWAWLGTASPRHHLLIRRHLKTGDLAFCYCYVPEGQLVTKTRLIRAAGLRWPVEEDFEFGKDCFGLDQSQVRLYTAIARHLVLIMAALAICAVTAALLRDRTDTQAPEPVRPDQSPPADSGMIPLTIPEIKHLLADASAVPRTARPQKPLAGLATTASGTLPVVPQAHQTRPGRRDHPGQLANGGCRTRRRVRALQTAGQAQTATGVMACLVVSALQELQEYLGRLCAANRVLAVGDEERRAGDAVPCGLLLVGSDRVGVVVPIQDGLYLRCRQAASTAKRARTGLSEIGRPSVKVARSRRSFISGCSPCSLARWSSRWASKVLPPRMRSNRNSRPSAAACWVICWLACSA